MMVNPPSIGGGAPGVVAVDAGSAAGIMVTGAFAGGALPPGAASGACEKAAAANAIQLIETRTKRARIMGWEGTNEARPMMLSRMIAHETSHDPAQRRTTSRHPFIPADLERSLADLPPPR
jgi:hypothetical protein